MLKICPLGVASLLALLLVLTSTGTLMAEPAITVESPLSWLSITPATDASFDAQVHATLTGDVIASIDYALPYSVVVTNHGSTPIAAITVRFDITTPGVSQPVPWTFFYHQFGLPTPLIAPGQSRVFTPLRTANALAAGAQAAFIKGKSGSIYRKEPITALSTATALHVAIDLAVAPDGRSAGRDRAEIVKTYHARKQAYTDMRGEVLNKIHASATQEQVLAWLQATPSSSVRRGDAPSASRYGQMRYSLSIEWRDTIRKKGLASLEQELVSVSLDPDFPGVDTLRNGGLQ